MFPLSGSAQTNNKEPVLVEPSNNPIQNFDTIASSEISLEIEALNICKDSLIPMEIETFDRLRPGLNSFHGEMLLIGSPHKSW